MTVFARDAGAQLNTDEMTAKEELILRKLAKRPYHWITVDVPRSRKPRQRLIDRGLIEGRDILGIDRQHCLTPKGREYLGIAEVEQQN